MKKQKIVIKFHSMNGQKSFWKALKCYSMDGQNTRCKAMTIAVGVSGVESVALKGDQIEVIGEGTDAVELVALLRKKVGSAELVSVSDIEEEKKKEEEKKNEALAQQLPPLFWPPNPCVYEFKDSSTYDPICSIM